MDDPLVVAVDGSHRPGVMGWAWVASDGAARSGYHITSKATAGRAEQLALAEALRHYGATPVFYLTDLLSQAEGKRLGRRVPPPALIAWAPRNRFGLMKAADRLAGKASGDALTFHNPATRRLWVHTHVGVGDDVDLARAYVQAQTRSRWERRRGA